VIRFLHPQWLWLLVFLPLLAWLLERRGRVAAVRYSSLQTLRQVAKQTRGRAGRWLTALNLAALALLIVGLATSPPSATAAANPDATDLAPNKVEPGSFVASLRPVLFAPRFIALQGLIAMALVTLRLAYRGKQRHAHDQRHPDNHDAENAIREQLAAMDEALVANSAPAFFRAARHAVQERLAQRWNLPVGQVTAAEISRRLNGNTDDLRTLFTFADAVVYSGQPVLSEDLKRWKDKVIHHLKQLEGYENSRHSQQINHQAASLTGTESQTPGAKGPRL
jgi:hypothetical protein